MKKNKILLEIIIAGAFLFFGFTNLNAQSSCADLLAMVKTEGYGSTYTSYSSDAISQVTFYEVDGDNYDTYYFALVKFTSSYQEYIYQVSSSTKSNYAMNYMQSAGEAFWQYVQPYNENLNCAPN